MARGNGLDLFDDGASFFCLVLLGGPVASCGGGHEGGDNGACIIFLDILDELQYSLRCNPGFRHFFDNARTSSLLCYYLASVSSHKALSKKNRTNFLEIL
jgi:hypothetical protein